MNNAYNLQSFVAEHERKLELKVKSSMKHPEESGKSYPSQYQSTLDRKFTPKKNSKVWPMRYEITPHEELGN